jgi:YYY domain-containing protein
LEEFLFLAGLLFWSFVRGQEPSIHGLEKFMDFGFMNSILRSDYFPPKDLWLTPLTLNYYYFGHLSAAVLFKLTGIIPEVGYNLVLASIFGLALSAVFSLGFNLFYQFICHNPQPDKSQLKDKKLSIANYLSPAKFASRQTKGNQLSIKPAVIAGLIATFLVNLGGNLHTIYAFTKGYPNEKPVPFWDLSPFGWNPQTYWYPNATRFIPFTIHEFPIYSYVVADLHGHVLNIPFVLFTIAIVFAVFFSKKIQPIHIILLPLLIASLYMGNATDGLVYGGLSGLIILYKWRSEVKRKLSKEKIEISKLFINFKDFIVSRFSQSGNNPPEFLSRAESRDYILPYKFLISLAWLAVGFVLFSLPFSLNFKLFVKGIGVVPANGHSPIYMLFILWGLPIFFAISFTWFHFGENLKPKIKSLFRGETLVKLIAKLTGTAIEVKNNSKLYIVNYKLAPSDILVFLLLIVSFGLIIFPEFFYFHDIYPLHYRANTMFKLGYQAFIMFGIANAYILVRLLQSKKVGPLFLVFSFLFSVLVSIYPYFAIKSYYGNLKNYKTLNGMNWLQAQYPSDFEAINWIRKNIPGQPVILEGVGESYTDYARISAFTGLPTVIGWPVHEWLWRGTYDEAGKRVAEMQQLFETSDINLAKNMLQKYNVKYVFIGQLEKQKYPKLEEEKFGKLGKIIFNNGTTKIYELAL